VFEGLVAASPIALISLVSPLSREIRLAGEGRFLGGGADERSDKSKRGRRGWAGMVLLNMVTYLAINMAVHSTTVTSF